MKAVLSIILCLTTFFGLLGTIAINVYILYKINASALMYGIYGVTFMINILTIFLTAFYKAIEGE